MSMITKYGNITADSPIISNILDLTSIKVGLIVYNYYIPTYAKVIELRDAIDGTYNIVLDTNFTETQVDILFYFGISSINFLPEEARTQDLWVKLCDIIDHVVVKYESNDYEKLLNKYNSLLDIDNEYSKLLYDEFGYTYIYDIMSYGNDIRILSNYINIIHYFKGTKLGLELVLGLLGVGFTLKEWWEIDPYTYTQDIPSTEWEIEHYIDTCFPTVYVTNQYNEIMKPLLVERVGSSKIILHFNNAVSGTAIVSDMPYTFKLSLTSDFSNLSVNLMNDLKSFCRDYVYPRLVISLIIVVQVAPLRAGGVGFIGNEFVVTASEDLSPVIVLRTGGNGSVNVEYRTINIITHEVADVTDISGTFSGQFFSPLSATRRGFCYRLGSAGDPTILDTILYEDGDYSSCSYNFTLTGLLDATNYRVRSYVVIEDEIHYGNTVQLLTKSSGVIVTTYSATDVTSISCTANGEFLSDLLNATRIGFCYVLGTSDPTISDSVVYEDGNFTSCLYSLEILDLTFNSEYRIRAYVIANTIVHYGDSIQLMTDVLPPRVLYWVNNGGYWDDPNHWSLSSGGVGGESLPTVIDSVIIDENSLSSDEQLIIFGTSTDVTPIVTTELASSITNSEFICNGTIVSTGGQACSRRGFCYIVGTSGDPTISDSTIYDDGIFIEGTFNKTLIGLPDHTNYRVRAYAVNYLGIGYGDTIQVTTAVVLATVTTEISTSITSNECTANGTILDSGGAGTDVTRRGFCYMVGTTGDPTIANSLSYTDGTFGVGSFTENIISLTSNTNYRIRAYVVNPAGISYGLSLSFQTAAVLATVTTQASSLISTNSFTGNGTVVDTGGSDITRRGFCYMIGTSGDPTVDNDIVYDDGTFTAGSFSKNIPGLSEHTGYRVRAYAVNSLGISYGSTILVTTPILLATVTTEDSTSITATGCICNGTVTDTGGTGLDVTRRGFCYMIGTSGDPTIANSVSYTDGNFGVESFTKSITLTRYTDYRIRAYAVNSAGISYGITTSIKTLALLATVTTEAISDNVSTSCTGNGTISDTGGVNATIRGFCYMVGTSGDPTIANSVISETGSYGVGAFALTISGLTINTNYRVRAFSYNLAGYSYGSTTVNIATFGLATGGTVTTFGNYKIHTFTSGGNFVVTKTGDYEYLLVGAGGLGSGNYGWSGGGGGGGGVVQGSTSRTPGTYPVVVAYWDPANRIAPIVANSTLFGLTALKGGDGNYSHSGASPGGNGACGGGAGGSTSTPGYGVWYSGGSGSQGGPGGAGMTGSVATSGYNSQQYGGGGGASGAAGAAAVNNGIGGDGGIGALSSITGTATYYGGGGGGYGNSSTGVKHHGVSGLGTIGQGGAGGPTGAIGKSGIVIIRYLFQ